MAPLRDRLASQTSQPVEANPKQVSVLQSDSPAAAPGKQAASTVLPPFSKKLKVDKKLKLSHEDFKQTVQEFHENKQSSATDQLKATPPYPTPHVLAQFASMAYRDCKHGDPNPPDGWKLLTTASHSGIKNGYFGTAYWHPEHQQVVIAHRGTDIKEVGALVTDVKGVLFNNYVQQMSSASTFANKVVSVLQEIEQEKKVCFELFFTGHSLGGWLAQITAFTTEYLEVQRDRFLKRLTRKEPKTPACISVQDIHDVRQSYHPHTVVFESPGCKDMLSQMADKLDVRLNGRSIDLQHLDITSYLSAPNRINTCNSHLGTVYRIFTDLSDMGRKEKHTPFYNIATHSMDKIVEVFDPDTGQVRKDDKGRLKIREVVDWPVSAGLTGGAELKVFFKFAEHRNYHAEVMDTTPSKVPKGYHPLRYQTKAYDECTQSLSIFNQDQREFLEIYSWLCHVKEFFQPEDLFSVMNNTEATNEAAKKLRNFGLGKENIRCPDAGILHALIPYVNRLVRLFPNIKENIKIKLALPHIRNRFYQHETQRYVKNIEQNALDFKTESLALKEFLTSDQQVWQLRMVDGDAWTGITKVYRVFQNTSCTTNYFSEDYYTILELKRLLTLNRLTNLSALLASRETSHLLMISCGTNQPVNDELRDMFMELFNILKQKKAMKIILTTQSGDTADFVQKMARETLGEGFITRDEQLTWSDLTPSSQRKLLEKEVIFQGVSVTLNQIISAESMTDSFPLAYLLQENELRIGEEPVLSACSGYNEKYYIDRTFSHNIFIRQDISRDKSEGKSDYLLASTEQEFEQYCQQNPKENVHWLQKDISGEFIWQQSQGNLSALREYIDTHKHQSYSPSDLDNLLQEATHHRVMLIADKAGIGKSTALTHLSKGIKQKFPAHWLVRIDLNDYTAQLTALKGKKMDKERVLEFISRDVLKLESDLEKELFKKSFEENEVNKLVVMVDGFDEISPIYKETVIDMLQVLKQTSLEQLWVTTRPHLRQELENNLQQLSYTLQPFSEVEQVEFLKKFWLQNSNIEDMDEKRLKTYAKALIWKLAQSISDKDREFTGIPLQTRILAEAFEQEFTLFYLSQKLEPELPHKLDLLGLYRRFIDRKYDIYYREKSETPADKVAAMELRERDLKNLQVEHQLLALEALFPEDQLTFLQTYNSTLSDEELARIGIAQRNKEGKPHFIHRAFAEYFVADILVKQLTKKNRKHVQMQRLLLNEVLLRKEGRVIRAIMDGLLENSKPSEEALKEYGEELYEQLNKEQAHGQKFFAKTALNEDNSRITGFLLDSLKSVQHSNAINMMFTEGGVIQTAWHTAAENRSVQVLERIWEWAEIVAPTKTYSLLLSKDSYGRTAFRQSIEHSNIVMAHKLWVWSKAKLTPTDLKNQILSYAWEGKNAWHSVLKLGSVEMLVKMWDWVKELQSEELKNDMWLSKDKYGKTAWHIAAERGDVEVLEKLWDWAKELQIKPEEIRDGVWLSKDKNVKTPWQTAVEKGRVQVLEKLWNWAKGLRLKPEELKYKVLLSKDKYGQTAWNVAAERDDVEVLQKLRDWAEEIQLNPEQLRGDVCLSKDNSGQTPWQKAAGSHDVELLQKLWNGAKEPQLNQDGLRNEPLLLLLLLSKDMYGQTAWHTAAGSGDVKVVQQLWDWANELQLNREELRKEVCLSKDNSGQTPWHKAAGSGSVEVLEKLWDWAKELKLNSEELKNDVLLSKDKYGQTACHMAAGSGSVEVLEKLWDWATELKLNSEELKNDVLLSKDKYGQTACHMAAGRGKVQVLEKLWDWAKELQLNSHELRKNFCLLIDNSGQTPLHKAAGSCNAEVLDILWDWAKELQLKPEVLKIAVCLLEDNSGQTSWHKVAESGNIEMFEKMCYYAKTLQLKPEELMNIVCFSKDMYGQTTWHMAAGKGNVLLLGILWDLAKKLLLNREELRNVCLLRDNSGQTAWHKAAGSGNVEVLKKLWDWAKEIEINPEELRENLLLSKDNSGQMPWHKAAESGNFEVLGKLWDFAKKLQLKPEDLRNEVLLSRDKSGQTAWHIAASRSYVEILDRMQDFAKELQLKPEDLWNEVLLSKDKSGSWQQEEAMLHY